MSSVATAVNTQALYRLYNADRELLYIGISKSALGRLAQHLDDKPWADEIATVKIERHPVSRFEIEQMERDAIIAERPRYNKAHNYGRADTAEYRANDPYDHSWMRQFCSDNYATMQSAVGMALQAYTDYKSPGDTDDSVWVMWRQLLNAANYYDAHDCTEPHGDRFTLPFRRTADGWCHYKCVNCGHVWKCWYR